MNQKRLYFYLAFAIYQCTAFIFTILVDGHLDLLGLLKFIPWFKYISFIGVGLFLADVIWYWVDKRVQAKRQSDLEKENDVLKARLYDFQEAKKVAGAPKEA